MIVSLIQFNYRPEPVAKLI